MEEKIEKKRKLPEKLVGRAWKKGAPSPNPNGRPNGQRNYATIYREALLILADKNSTTPERFEAEMVANGAVLARKGNYKFYKDILDRIHGTPVSRTDITSNGQDMSFMQPQIIVFGENDLLKTNLLKINGKNSSQLDTGTTSVASADEPSEVQDASLAQKGSQDDISDQ